MSHSQRPDSGPFAEFERRFFRLSSKGSYAGAISDMLAEEIEQHLDTTFSIDSQLSTYEKSENLYNRRLRKSCGKIRPRGRKQQVGEELEKLADSPKIERISFEDGVLTVFTKKLYCTSPKTGREYRIGRMRISIYTVEGTWEDIGVDNMDFVDSQYDAPHICGGEMCTGDVYDEILEQLWEAQEFVAIVYTIIQFVESYESLQAYCSIADWPISRRKKSRRPSKRIFG